MLDEHRQDAIKESAKKLYALKREYEESGGGITITQNTSEKTMSFIHNNPESVSLIGTFAIYDQELLNEVQKQMKDYQELLLVSYPETDEMKVYTVHLQEKDEKEEKKGGGSGGCFIATAVYGSYNSPEIIVLRKFRNTYLLTNTLGKIIVQAYYLISPKIAEYIHHKPYIIRILKKYLLDKIVKFISQRKES